jgi:hypothetical protein
MDKLLENEHISNSLKASPVKYGTNEVIIDIPTETY